MLKPSPPRREPSIRREPPASPSRVPGLPGCRIGSLFCPIEYLREIFATLYSARSSAEFAPYLRTVEDVDLNLANSLRRDQTTRTGDQMYAQFLREVPRGEWSEPFREAIDRASTEGDDFRRIIVDGQARRCRPLDILREPWVVHATTRR